MRLLPWFAALVLLTSCGEAAPGTGADELGTVTGRVLTGPMCPVQIEASPCPEEPLAGEVVQLVQGRSVVATATSDARGNFSFEVEPGAYELAWAPTGDVGIRFAKPVPVTVVTGETVTADLLVDTGIR